MKRRTHICAKCGKLERLMDKRSGKKTHCDVLMEPLTYEQGYLAVRLDPQTRILWYEKGGYILKGPTKRKRWIPAMTEKEIEEAKLQKKNHVKKKPRSRQGLGFYMRFLIPMLRPPEMQNKSNKRMLFLDDIRNPSDCLDYMGNRSDVDESIYSKQWHIVRSYNEFIKWFEIFGLPDFISFDYDLGDFSIGNVHGYTGLDCAKWLVNYCRDYNLSCPDFVVHSTNKTEVNDIAALLNDLTKK